MDLQGFIFSYITKLFFGGGRILAILILFYGGGYKNCVYDKFNPFFLVLNVYIQK